MTDPISAPDHYAGNGIECMDAMESAFYKVKYVFVRTKKGKLKKKKLKPIIFFWWGNAFKYLWRWPKKNGLQDLKKCRQCIDNLIKKLEPHEQS